MELNSNSLNIFETYLDTVLSEAGTSGKHNRWFYGAEQGSIDTLATFARTPDGFNTPESAKQKTANGAAWRDYATDQGGEQGGEHKVYWVSLSGPQSASASTLLAAIAKWKPEEEPDAEQFKKEGEALPAQQEFDAEQQALAEEEAEVQQERQTDRQTDPETVEKVANILAERLELDPNKARKMAETLDANCKKPTDHKFAKDYRALLAYTRTDEHKFGLPGEANAEMMDAFVDLLEITKHIKRDSEGEYVLEEDLTERQKDILTSVRARGQKGQNGVYVGYDGDRAHKVFPNISQALVDIQTSLTGQASEEAKEAADIASPDLFKYGVSVRGSEPIGEALGGVKIRKKDGSEELMLNLTSAAKTTASNKSIGEFTEKSWVGMVNFMTTGADDGTLQEGIQSFAKHCQLMAQVAASNPDKLRKQLPDVPFTAQEEAELEWFDRANDFYNTHGQPNELVKAVFMQNAMNLARVFHHAQVAPISAREPDGDEPRGNDLKFGVKRDIVFDFANNSDAVKFCKSLGLGSEYAHGTEVDLSLKQLTRTTGKVNNEGATLPVALGQSTNSSKQQQFEDHKESTYDKIRKMNLPSGRSEKLVTAMDKARDWDTEQWSTIFSALHPKNGKVQGSMSTLFNSVLDKNCPPTPEGLKRREGFNQLWKDYKASMEGSINPTKESWVLAQKLFGALKHHRSETDEQYRHGSSLNETMGCLTSSHSEILMRMHQDKVAAYGADGALADTVDACQNGNLVSKPNGGFYITDDSGNRISETSYVVAVGSNGQPFIRLRGGFEGKRFNDESYHIPPDMKSTP